ncbi:unnamed protein product [Microthlaspi erraticum]|uniref:F-box domain-containing protein n=1 Tax=Microthlaspi erraticum TaxID=1685480 RepID=A0A6D2K7G2_9BRAS|nr:unnamed protein product [Microthlaspi erraticum]
MEQQSKSTLSSLVHLITETLLRLLPQSKSTLSFLVDLISKTLLRLLPQSKSTTLSLPVDLTSEILLRLPEKSVARFRCVSKLWSSITTDPYFINLLETRSPRPSLLHYLRKGDNLVVSLIPQHTPSLHPSSNKCYSSSLMIDRYRMKLPEDSSYFGYPTEFVHGLICFVDTIETLIVWNPSKRQFLTLPKQEKSVDYLEDDVKVFLGYDPIEGGIYYIAGIGRNRTVYDLMSFDDRSEQFHIIEVPSGIHDIHGIELINYKGRVACTENYNNDRRLWILEDAEKHKWSTQDFVSPLYENDMSSSTGFYLKGFTHDGEFIYVPDEKLL